MQTGPLAHNIFLQIGIISLKTECVQSRGREGRSVARGMAVAHIIGNIQIERGHGNL